MADNLGISPGQPEGANFPGEFIPSQRRECEDFHYGGGWGRPTSTHEYIWYGNLSKDDYPDEACTPWYHRLARINSLQIINSGESGNTAGITGSGGISITGNVFCNNLTSTATVSAVTISSTFKPFNIPHPTQEGKRLVHASLEGPENGVYQRGRLTNKNVIELPEYWRGLVDPESISVNLTQIGKSQDLIIESIEWGTRVRIKSGNGTDIDCFYTVYGTRKDVGPLPVVMEEGEEWPYKDLAPAKFY